MATNSPSESCQQRGRLYADETKEEPAFFTLFTGQDIIHQILVNQAQVAPPHPGAVAVPAAGTGGGAAAISYQRFVQFVDGVATKVGMVQDNFTKHIS